MQFSVSKVASSKFLSFSSRLAAVIFRREGILSGSRRVSTIPGEGDGNRENGGANQIGGQFDSTGQLQEQQGFSSTNEAGSPATQHDESRNRRVFIGNLAYRTTPEALTEHLSKAGKIVKAQILVNHLGRSVGGAIVEFETEQEAKAAIETLYDSLLDGRKLTIREDRENFSLHDPKLPRKVDSKSLQSKRIVVWNLPSHVRWQELKDLFKETGNIVWTEVRNVRTRDGGETVMGTVLFETEEEARQAVEKMKGRNFLGRMIDCRFDDFP
eukprot:jgi/Galph1/5089/GphlegSOOS_G3724.1